VEASNRHRSLRCWPGQHLHLQMGVSSPAAHTVPHYFSTLHQSSPPLCPAMLLSFKWPPLLLCILYRPTQASPIFTPRITNTCLRDPGTVTTSQSPGGSSEAGYSQRQVPACSVTLVVCLIVASRPSEAEEDRRL
jgi:hypothetical protein